MKRILPEFVFSDEQLNMIRRLAKECNLCEDTVRILYGRGICDEDSIQKFMHPSKSHFISPFKMQGMREAVELIKRARDEEWEVVVYGDYDADGICASTIMANVLRDFGIEANICVPERQNGYGLSVTLIDEIFDEFFPQLFITVDCGISCAKEVEYIKELGAEVIITDHHELPDTIPDCICINPKFNDGYIYDNLCGAGVAFKVGCALLGEAAYKYLDFAAIATVADSVPLTGENRDIVYEGLNLINDTPSDCYVQFLNRQDSVTSQTLAFTIAPKINAAGRMGDAKAALTLFNERDKTKIFDLSAKLTAYNLERQKCCDELYSSAKQMIKDRGRTGRVIMLYNESWNSGFVGIVAARIAEEFSCPTILFVKNGDTLKGSARSIENVNIFEALKACESYIAEFGGHSQAAGVNVKLENFDNLNNALEEFLSNHYVQGDFVPTVFVNGSLDASYSEKFVRELELLEPFGVGNRRPMFEIDARSLSTRVLKPQGLHLSLKSGNLDLMYFGGAKYKKILESGIPKKLIFEYNVSTFRGKEYIKGFVRDLIYDSSSLQLASDEIAIGGINALSNGLNQPVESISKLEIEQLMARGGIGTLFVCWQFSTINKFENASNLNVDIFNPSAKSNLTQILLAPDSDADLSGYKRIIYLDGNESFVNRNFASKLYDEALVPDYINKLTCERQALVNIFTGISANSGNFNGCDAAETAIINSWNYEKPLVYFAIKVFEQLGIISYANGKLEIVRGVKSKLENSALYNAVDSIIKR